MALLVDMSYDVESLISVTKISHWSGADPGIFVGGGGGSNLPKKFYKPKKKKINK